MNVQENEPLIQGVVLIKLDKDKGYEDSKFVASKPELNQLPIEKDALPLFVFPNRDLDVYNEADQENIDDMATSPMLISPKRCSFRDFEKECKRYSKKSKREKHPSRFHFFVMTSQLGDKTFVYCARRRSETSETALLILSTLPFHSTFQRILIHVEHLHGKIDYTSNTVERLYDTLHRTIPKKQRKQKGVSLTIPISNETFGLDMPKIDGSAPSWIKTKNGQAIYVSQAKEEQTKKMEEQLVEDEPTNDIRVDLLPTALPQIKLTIKEDPGRIHAFLQPNLKYIGLRFIVEDDGNIKISLTPKQPIHLTLYTDEPKININMRPCLVPHIHVDLHYRCVTPPSPDMEEEQDTTSIIISSYVKATLQNLINSYEPGMERSPIQEDVLVDVKDDYCYNSLQQFTFSNPKEKSLPLCDIDFRVLISSCTPKMLIQCIESALNERQMVFFSESPRVLVESIEGLMSLLYPFEWPHVYIPLLPTSLTDFLEAPYPYIIGLVRQRNANGELLLMHDEFDLMNVDEKCLFIDLDSSTIKSHVHYFNEYDYSLEKRMYDDNPEETTCPIPPEKDDHLQPFFPAAIQKKLLRLLDPFYEAPRHSLFHPLIFDDSPEPSTDDMALQMPIDVTLRSESNLYHSSFLSSHHYSSSSDDEDEDNDAFVSHSKRLSTSSRRSIYSKMELFPTSLPRTLRNVPPLQVKKQFIKYLRSYHMPSRMLILLPDSNNNYAYHESSSTHQELCSEDLVPYIYPRIHPTTQSLRRIFIRTNLSLFKSYRLYIRDTEDPSLLPFDTPKFLTEQSSEESYHFYKAFLNTQLFHFFVQKRSMPSSTHRDIFDQKAFSSMNRFSIQLSILSDKSQQGFAWKLGRILKNWRYRFFVLKEHTLAYYKDDPRHRSNQKRRGVLHLIPGVTRVFIPVEDTFNKHSLKTPFPIVIKNPNRTLVCAFTSSQDHLNWYRLLKAKVMNKYYRDEIMKKYAIERSYGNAGQNLLKQQLLARQETFQIFLRRKISSTQP